MRKSDKGLAGLKRLRERALQDAAGGPEPPRAGKQQRPGRAMPESSPDARAPSQPSGHAASNPPADAPCLTAEDAVLFRRAMKQVAPLCAAKRVVLPPMPAGPKALLRQRRERAAGGNDPPAPPDSATFPPARPAPQPTRFH